MASLPIYVKRRDASGKVAQILCDTVEGAKSNAQQFRDMGFTDVWMEDVDGVKIDESKL
jgi:hypothetical protein